MPTIYQQETLEFVIGLLLDGQGKGVPHHCLTKSESAISRFLNHYNWSTRSLIHTVRSFILNYRIVRFCQELQTTNYKEHLRALGFSHK